MKEKFLEVGYKTYNELDKVFLQKAIYDENGNKKYFINVKIHDFRSLKEDYPHLKDAFSDFLYEGDVQFNLKDDTTFNVTLLHVESVEQTEKFFENVFNKLDCRKYDY